MDSSLSYSLVTDIGALLLLCLLPCLLYLVIRFYNKRKKQRELDELHEEMDEFLTRTTEPSELELRLSQQEKAVKEKNSSAWCLAELADLAQVYRGTLKAYTYFFMQFRYFKIDLLFSAQDMSRLFDPVAGVSSMIRKTDFLYGELAKLSLVIDRLPALCFNLEKGRRLGCEEELLAIYANVKLILKTSLAWPVKDWELRYLFDEIEELLSERPEGNRLEEEDLRAQLSELAEEWAEKAEKIKPRSLWSNSDKKDQE